MLCETTIINSYNIIISFTLTQKTKNTRHCKMNKIT